MVYAAERRAAVAAVLGLVPVPRARLVAPAEGDVGLAADHNRVGQAADPIGHFAAAVRTNGHDPPLLDVVADHLRPVRRQRGWLGCGRPRLPYAAAMTTTQNEAEKAAPAGLLAGKVCVVSGVGPGLGRRVARALAAHGAGLGLGARRPSDLDGGGGGGGG